MNIKSNKKTIHVFGSDYFLLGINQDNEYVYMQDFSFDCSWYWGGGYLTTFTNNKNPTASRDISSHYHFEGLTEHENINLYDAFNKHFKMSVLSDKEKWILVDLMDYFYTLRKGAEQVARGGSNYTTVDGMPKHTDLSKQLNGIIENEVIPAVRKLLNN